MIALLGWLRRRLSDDRERGSSLIELSIVTALLGMIGMVVYTSLSTGATAVSSADDQNRGQADLQVVVEWLSRDLRAARGVDPAATGSQLTLWIDSDSDYQRDAIESVTWRIQAGDSAGQFDVERVTGPLATGRVQVIGSSLVSALAFSYEPTAAATVPELARAVRVAMEYDAIVGAHARSKFVSFEVRLRNVE